ncbi:putative prolyl-tRNA synthetase associated domain-containing protein 1 [Babylonia areolata]|uniref:putative prolyl-tRNA synthetase associated domain-containing protein 1 n=1 Tax=Babylonia areolata TaxID=304850 RepID=UPI003FD49327
MEAPKTKSDLLAKLEELGISAATIDHEAVFTVEQALPLVASMDGIFAKNLFLNDKKKNLYLYCAPHFIDTKLNELAKQVGVSGGFRFASEERLTEALGLKQGSVSVFGLINDPGQKVKLVLDRKFWEEESAGGSSEAEAEGGDAAQGGGEKCLLFHPLVNTATTGISIKGLKAFLNFTGHKPIIV